MRRSSEQLLARLLAEIERELPAAEDLRRRLHAAPERSNEERATAATLARELPTVPDAAAGTGLLALVGGAHPGAPAVAVRAELDGLRVRERTGAQFSARGELMHACGHDVHMAALVALARAAHALGGDLPAPLLAVFQPSEEEYPSGAQALARGELAQRRPSAVLGVHVHPELRWGTVALTAGPVNASYDSMEITVRGEPSHAAYPHLGRDPVLALAQIVVALHATVGRRIDPLHPAVLTITVLEGSQAENAIPATARAGGAIRAYRREDRERMRALVREVADGVAAAHGCSATVTLVEGEPALENDPEIVMRARRLLAPAGFAAGEPWRSCGSDDLAFFAELAPLAMAFVGLDGAEGFERRPLHHPELLPPDAAVGAVARAQAILYVAAASRDETSMAAPLSRAAG